MKPTLKLILTTILLSSPFSHVIADDDPAVSTVANGQTLQSNASDVAATTEAAAPAESDADSAQPERSAQTITTLQNLASLKNQLQTEIQGLSEQLKKVDSSVAKKELMDKIEKLGADVQATDKNIQEIAAGADIASLRSKEEPAFDFQQELFSLLEPAMKEMKEMTSHVRQKTAQRDRIEYYSSKLPTAKSATDNLESVLMQTEDPALRSTLQSLLEAWKNQRTFLESEIQSAELQLAKLEREEIALSESSQSYFKSFLQNRGLYLGRAILVVLVIILLSRLIHKTMERFIPGYQKAHRSFRIRLLDLAHRVITVLLIIVGPMVVFYFAEDWLLFSLGILLLLGMALTMRHAIPKYWHLMQLFLNVGTVREGERIEMNGLPWRVQKINFYTQLENPKAGMIRRVKIDDLLDIRSREINEHEPWFPCKTGDWVLFENDRLAKVVSISEELIELVLRGGARKTFTTPAFLDCAVTCLSQNFRIKEIIGVSYSLQAESVSTLCGELKDYVQKRIEEEGYGGLLINLSVEFELANTSSLDVAVIADFDGDAAPQHNRLRRSLQRWCVEACTQHGWEIPFTQVTLHQPEPVPS